MPEVVNIARCPEHGLHGERTECFVCGGEVEQVPMVPCDDAAVDRAVEAAIDFDTDNADPNRGWYLQLARKMFRAAGETP